MAVTLNASASAGLITTADTSTILQLQTGGTTALAVSAAQVVTLTNPLPVASGGSGGTTSTGSGANVLGTTPSFTSTIGVGGATASASGAGITFPSTDLHYSTNANTLDDYEEGTWTPTNVGGMTGFSAIDGTYTKIGRNVQVRGAFSITSVTSNMVVGGLPFTSMDKVFHSVVDQNIPVALAYRRVDNNATTIQWNVNVTGSFSVTIQFTAWYFTS